VALSVATSSTVGPTGPSQAWIRIPKPFGTNPGDLLVAATWLDNDGSMSSLTAPAGWALLGSNGVPTSGFARTWWKFAGNSEPTTYQFGGVFGSDGMGAMVRIIGLTGAPLSISADINTSANATNHTAPSEFTTDVDALYIGLWAGVVATTCTWTPPAGFTNRGAALSQTLYMQGILATKSFGAGATGAPVATTSTWNGFSPQFGDLTGAVLVSQGSSAGSLASGAQAGLTAGASASGTVTGAGGTVAPSVKYRYDIDWNGDGLFTGTGENVSTRVLANTAVTISYGRDQARALSPIKPGVAGFELDNTSRDYSPDNASSPLFGKVLPARDNKITATFQGVDYVLWRGHLDDFAIDPTPGHRVLTVTCIDALADLSEVDVYTPLYRGIRTGAAVHAILDAIGWPSAQRDIDPGATVIKYWWEEGTNAWDALRKLVTSEGPPAFLAINPDTNSIMFRDRSHRMLYPASKASQATFRDAGADPRFSWPLGYTAGWRDIINSVTFSVPGREPLDPGAVWTSDATWDFAANETKTVIVVASEPFMNAQVPFWPRDFQLPVGSVVMSIGRDSGQSTIITMTEAAGLPAQVVGLQLWATSLPVRNTSQVSITDSASIGAYGVKTYPDPADWANTYDAEAVAQIIVSQRAQRLPTVDVRLLGASTTTLGHQLARDLSDRVTIVDAETGLNGDFYLEQINHSITGAGNRILETHFGCEKIGPLVDDPATVFIFGSPTNGKFGTGLFGH
jgi:hypothetical protein